MSDLPRHRAAAAPPRAAVTAVLDPDGTMRAVLPVPPATADTSPQKGDVGAAGAAPGEGSVATPTNEEIV